MSPSSVSSGSLKGQLNACFTYIPPVLPCLVPLERNVHVPARVRAGLVSAVTAVARGWSLPEIGCAQLLDIAATFDIAMLARRVVKCRRVFAAGPGERQCGPIFRAHAP